MHLSPSFTLCLTSKPRDWAPAAMAESGNVVHQLLIFLRRPQTPLHFLSVAACVVMSHFLIISQFFSLSRSLTQSGLRSSARKDKNTYACVCMCGGGRRDIRHHEILDKQVLGRKKWWRKCGRIWGYHIKYQWRLWNLMLRDVPIPWWYP